MASVSIGDSKRSEETMITTSFYFVVLNGTILSCLTRTKAASHSEHSMKKRQGR